MKSTRCTLLSVSFAVSVALASSTPAAEPAVPLRLDNEFFAFDNGTGRGSLSPKDQAELVKQLGYAGIGYTGTGRIPEMLAALDAAGVKMYSIYVNANVSTENPTFSPNLRQAIEQLKGRQTVIWLTVTGRPGDGEHDDRAVAAVRTVGQWAQAAGLRVALYPHVGFYVARFEDATRVADEVDLPNVGTSFNLCHWIKIEGDRDNAPLLRKAMPRLMLVSINGAEYAGGWDKLIQTLDRGQYDVFGFLKSLRAMGYTGPVGLQCYAIKGDRRENLRRSIGAWREFAKRMKDESGRRTDSDG
jgi:sugar phosphate isomerase/epimerase